MKTEQTFFDVLKGQYRYGGVTVKLIAVNFLIFVLIGSFSLISELMGRTLFINGMLADVFMMNTNFSEFIYSPWTLLTSIFAHFNFLHIFFNMLMLYFVGKVFEQEFNGKRLVFTYLLGGFFGGFFELLAHLIFPLGDALVLGASGSVMAIFVALAFYRPNLSVQLIPGFPIKIIVLALIFIVANFLSLGTNDGIAHFAHIGGAILGIISVQNVYSSTNIVTMFQRVIENIGAFLSKFFGKGQPRMKVEKGGRQPNFKSDEQYNMEAKQKQAEIDRILDKISKSGYESLTKAEKEFLFRQSNNGK